MLLLLMMMDGLCKLSLASEPQELFELLAGGCVTVVAIAPTVAHVH